MIALSDESLGRQSVSPTTQNLGLRPSKSRPMAAPAAPAASACVEDVRAGSTFTAASNAAGDGAPPPPAAAFDGNGNGGCDSHAGHMEEMMVGEAAAWEGVVYSKVAPASQAYRPPTNCLCILHINSSSPPCRRLVQRMLIERMDRHTTGHYLRAYMPLDIANPAPLGFFAFSLTTCLFMVEENKLTEAATQVSGGRREAGRGEGAGGRGRGVMLSRPRRVSSGSLRCT